MSAIDLFSDKTKNWFQDNFNAPTAVQEESWPAIKSGGNVLISAPTGTGKTLSAFLVFIDELKARAQRGWLTDELCLVYISPLKALGNDIRENLRRPLDGIDGAELRVMIRTGDTSASERRRMIKKPPHILITTPESLFLLLTSESGKNMLRTAEKVIIDELHALIASKRGAHLMLSLARLDFLCGKKLQRVGLSATIEPLETAAEYLSPGADVSIVAPAMRKNIAIEIISPLPDMRILPEGTIWPELAKIVYANCEGSRTVIAFVESRMHAEKLAYYVNEAAGCDFALTHHGCVSKEQRLAAEQKLRSGELRLLCATSSMELGIDVGEVDLVLQIGYPRTVSGALQRLGRAGHNPDRVSRMYMLPRMASEGLYCGMTAQLAGEGAIEKLIPPKKCLDVLAQHLVSMASGDGYHVHEAQELLKAAYNFMEVTLEELESVLRLLAGDFEHELDHPVRPRILYDRINGHVLGDAYSRLLALSAGGTIPDRGWYTVRSGDGARLGELDEEFVFEARVGDKFLLGAFAWRISEIRRDDVIVTQASSEGAQSPFWRGDPVGRAYETSLRFGEILRSLNAAVVDGPMRSVLCNLGLDENAADNAGEYLLRQVEVTGVLPDDKTIVIEHFIGETGGEQMMVHSVFGRRVNAPLSLLAQAAASRQTGMDIAYFDEDDGFLLFPYGGERDLPYGILESIDIAAAEKALEIMLPKTPTFNMSFRYNAARALIFGIRKSGRQPLWIQRLRSAESLDNSLGQEGHPIVAETIRECLNDYWDLGALREVLGKINSGEIKIIEINVEEPSPMSLGARRGAESVLLYDYTPMTSGVSKYSDTELENLDMIKPAPEELGRVGNRTKLPGNLEELHSLLMIEGDLAAGELDVPVSWLESLARHGRAMYIEPGLWIAAEQSELYEEAIGTGAEALSRVVRRLLRYRGAQDAEGISERYFVEESAARDALETLLGAGNAVEDDGLYYHAELYSRARRETVMARRSEIETLPPERYQALLCARTRLPGEPGERLKAALGELLDTLFPYEMWESVLLPMRVGGYESSLLDEVLAEGEFYWLYDRGRLSFHRTNDTDYGAPIYADAEELTPQEAAVVNALKSRGAAFAHSLPSEGEAAPIDALMSLMARGLVRSDSFSPVRKLRDREKLKNSANIKQRARMRAGELNSGRWELIRPQRQKEPSELIGQALGRGQVLTRETISGMSWSEALAQLRVLEYTGKVRRGYFVRGLSGAQFVEVGDFRRVVSALRSPPGAVFWMNAADPGFIWGAAAAHMEGRQITRVSGTVVALRQGVPVAALEKRGAELRVFEAEHWEEAALAFARDYEMRRIFADRSRIVIKSPRYEHIPALEKAGFRRQMMDYVLWQKRL